MSGFIEFAFILILALQACALAIALIARVWTLNIEPMTLRGTDVEHATNLVAIYVESVHDHRFAFPTGIFRADAQLTRPGYVLAREVNLRGSVGFGLIKWCFAIPVLCAAVGEEFGAAGAIVGFMVGAMIAAMVIAPILFIAVLEIVLRWLMRSRIEAFVERHPSLEDAVTVRYELHGLSAFGIEGALRHGMAPPLLPVAYHAAAGIDTLTAQTPVTPRNRLQLVYGGGGLVALLVAIVVVATQPSIESSGGFDQTASSDERADPASVGGGSGSGGESSTGGEDDPSGGEEEPTAEEPQPAAAGPLSESDKMKRAVRRHWFGRLRGTSSSLASAYRVYGAPLRRKAGGSQSRWSDEIAKDGLQDIDITHIDAESIGRGQGKVNLHITTDASLTGCHRWNFTYRMRRSNGRWLMYNQTLHSKRGC